MTADWRALIDAGVGVTETARRCGVSRVTIWRRLNGRSAPGSKAAREASARQLQDCAAERAERLRDAREARRRAVWHRTKAGWGASEIAADLGCSTATIYTDRRAMGAVAQFVPRRQSIAVIVADMKPLDAVNYLIEAYDNLAGNVDPAADAAFAVGLTGAQARVFSLLLRNQGKVVHFSAIADALDAASASGVPNSRETIRVYITKMRKRMAGSPYRIVNVWGHGYRLDTKA